MTADLIVHIGPATLDDIPDIVRMADGCSPYPENWTEKRLRHVVTTGRDGAVLLVAEIAESRSVVGFVGLKPWDDTFIIVGLGVDPQHRRRGIGRILMGAAICRAAGAGAKGVKAAVVGDNQAGQLFLRDCRFKAVRIRRRLFHRQGGHFVFRHDLTAPAGAAEAS